MAQRLQADKDVVIAAADRDMTDAKVELNQTSREIEGLELELDQMKQVCVNEPGYWWLHILILIEPCMIVACVNITL